MQWSKGWKHFSYLMSQASLVFTWNTCKLLTELLNASAVLCAFSRLARLQFLLGLLRQKNITMICATYSDDWKKLHRYLMNWLTDSSAIRKLYILPSKLHHAVWLLLLWLVWNCCFASWISLTKFNLCVHCVFLSKRTPGELRTVCVLRNAKLK